MTIEKVILDDIQGLFGGQDFSLLGNGTVNINIVNFRDEVKSRKYKSSLSEKHLSEIENLIEKYDFFNITIPERPGIPDEAHPTITVKLVSGEEKRIMKWVGQEHEGFDAILSWIHQIIEEVVKNNKSI